MLTGLTVCLSKATRRRLLHRRQVMIEGSFADAANNHGFKQARWRGLAAVRIQNLLIAACQNLRKLLRAIGRRGRAAAVALPGAVARLWRSPCPSLVSPHIS